MNDRYYVFNKGRKRGPFSLDDLLNETERGEAEYEDFCLRIGATTCEKIREVLDWEDEHFISPPEQQIDDALPEPEVDIIESDDTEEFEITENKESDHEDDYKVDEDNLRPNDEDDFEEISSDDDDGDIENDDADLVPIDSLDEENEYLDDPDQEFEDEEEHENELLETDEYSDDSDEGDEPPDYENLLPAPHRPPQDSTAILYSGRPSLLSYPKSLLLVALSLSAGIYFREHFDWILLAGIAFALFVFIQAQLRRSRHQYYITPKRVEVIHGLILENSGEIRIEDIGAIHIRQRGLQGLLGLASIEFAAVESPMPILVFYNVRAARRIKDLVRRLQDALEYPD